MAFEFASEAGDQRVDVEFDGVPHADRASMLSYPWIRRLRILRIPRQSMSLTREVV
jgi:hypothetical protein